MEEMEKQYKKATKAFYSLAIPLFLIGIAMVMEGEPWGYAVSGYIVFLDVFCRICEGIGRKERR